MTFIKMRYRVLLCALSAAFALSSAGCGKKPGGGEAAPDAPAAAVDTLTAAAVDTQAAAAEPAAAAERGAFTDARDGREYKTVTLGGLTWMAENLHYKPKSGKTWCYANKPDNCEKYGRLYDWTAKEAACPKGYHLPSWDEWEALIFAAGGEKKPDDGHSPYSWTGAEMLKAKSGWSADAGGNGTDAYGFSALPGGSRAAQTFIDNDGGAEFPGDAGKEGIWWNADCEDCDGYAHFSIREDARLGPADEVGGLSVRCVADADDAAWRPGLERARAAARAKAETRAKEEARAKAEAQTAKNTFYFTDKRDGRKYRAVTLGGRSWMAENVNYKAANSWCYGDADSNCAKYGRLYEWESAKSSCPAGYHLPSKEDWDALAKSAGGGAAGRALKSKAGWEKFSAGIGAGGSVATFNGADEYGFAALAGGRRSNSGQYSGIGQNGVWWTETEYTEAKGAADFPAVFGAMDQSDGVKFGDADKKNGYAVRCVGN